MTTQHSLRCPYKAMQVSHKSLYTKYHHPMPYYRPNLMSSYGLLYSGSPHHPPSFSSLNEGLILAPLSTG